MYNMEKLGFIYFVVFSQAACQSKLSLLFFTHKMIGTARLGIFYLHYIALMALIVIVALCQILFIVVSCIQCQYVQLSRVFYIELTFVAHSKRFGILIRHTHISASIPAYSFLLQAL